MIPPTKKRTLNIQGGMADWLARKEAEKRDQKSRQFDSKRVQFLAVKNDVEALLEQGYARRSIWLYLTDLQLLDCTYATFCGHVRREKNKPPLKSNRMPVEQAKHAPHSSGATTTVNAPVKPPETKRAALQKTSVPISPPANGASGFKLDLQPDPSIFEEG